ncbi:tRNA(Ile)-lysidine synthetase [Staphylococcus warneri]|nr:tRNA(Ile)-lysidine synthetase [Staphylococcus warneri]
MMELDATGWSKQDHIVLAVSTGIDSMCLLHLLLNEYQHTYSKLTCIHVNHGLRQASIEEEAFFKTYCEEHQIEYFIKRLDLSETVEAGNSIQNVSRQYRYDWFDSIMKQLGANVLLTAHHQDDQIETIFYRLFTGRFTRSHLGIAYTSQRSSYQLIRPMLDISKAAIKSYQNQYNIPFFEDVSNHKNVYVRNDIRNRIIPAVMDNQQLDVAHLLKLKSWHDQELATLRKSAHHFIKEAVQVSEKQDKIVIPRGRFNRLTDNMKVHVLDQLFEKTTLSKTISDKMYQTWFNQISNQKSQFTIDITDKWIIQIAYDTLIMMANTEMNDVNSTQVIEVPHTYRFGDYEIEIQPDFPLNQFPLTIRQRQNGDRFLLNGYAGKHKKVSRLLIDKKIDAIERNRLPVVINAEGKIIAVGQLFMNKDYKHYINIRNIGDE